MTFLCASASLREIKIRPMFETRDGGIVELFRMKCGFTAIFVLLTASLAGLSAAESAGKIELGPPETVLADQALGLRYFPDGRLAVVRRAPDCRVLVSAGVSSFLLEGPEMNRFVRAAKVLDKGARGEFDNGYAGINAAVRAKTGELLAFYHAEDQEQMKTIGHGIPGFYCQVAMAVSKDDGATFQKIGPILSGQLPKDPNGWPDQGVGEPWVLAEPSGEFFYAYYTSHERVQSREAQICMARCPVADASNPRAWKKYHDGEFAEPGIGGKYTPVVTSGQWQDALFPHVAYIASLRQFMMTFCLNAWREAGNAKQSGFYAAFSDDGIHWPRERVKQIWAVPVIARLGYEVAWHPTFIPDDGNGSRGQLYYGYSKNWGHAPPSRPHYMMRRRMTIGNQSAANPASAREDDGHMLRGKYACAVPMRESGGMVETDLCVYGGTSGGVAAAVQAARMGKRVVLLEPGGHLGGMTAGGLSAVDIGDPRSVGGIAREYFTNLAATAGVTLAWDRDFKSVGGGPATGGAYAIEPHKAERLFNDMVRKAGVKVFFGARLAAVKKSGARITELITADGGVLRAKIFLDATYEGDLMAKAGVTYTLLREGNAKYGETLNGIQYQAKYEPRTNHLKPGPTGRVPGGQGVWDRDFPLDPFVVKGDPKSGLLPLIQEGVPGKPGDPAPGVQAYCYRLCLTTNPANMLPILPPPHYDPKQYEIVVRFIEACQAIGDDMDLRWFSKHDPLPNDKWDFNTATFGGNLPGASHAWPEASYAEREKIAKQHDEYHRGLLHFLATDPRVPEKVRREMSRFGLPKDEFPDTGGWPHQLYVREARRMVSDLVMTEHHTFGRQVAPKSIGLGSYGTDVHEIRRIVKDGVVTREGKIAANRGGAPPYPIGYDAIVPKQAECENLFVTFALSASHTAFASIRMEPVFMVASQSAATAACLAIDEGVPVQKLDYAKLRERLESDGQVLEFRKQQSK